MSEVSMTPDQVRNRTLDLVVLHPPCEVMVSSRSGTFVGTVTFVGNNVFRLDTPLSACFFKFGEVDDIGPQIN